MLHVCYNLIGKNFIVIDMFNVLCQKKTAATRPPPGPAARAAAFACRAVGLVAIGQLLYYQHSYLTLTLILSL